MPPKPPGGIPIDAKIIVWFDHPRDCLCFGTRVGLEPGEALPPNRIVSIPLRLGEDFIEAVMNAATSAAIMGDGDHDYDGVMYGVQKILDQRMVTAIDLAEEFRNQRRKDAGGGAIDSAKEMVAVCASEFARLERLKGKVLDLFESVVGPGQVADGKLEDLSKWMEEQGFYES